MHRLVVIIAVAVALTSTVRAEDKAKAREAYQQATQHYDLGEYKEALESFKKAYRNFEDPAFLFNIAQCHRHLGDNQQAVRDYRMYLLKLPNALNATEVRELIAKLERVIAEEQASKFSPPEGTAAPGATPATTSPSSSGVPSTAAVEVAKPAASATARRPLYRRWWLWTSMAAVVVIGVGVGVGVGVSQAGHTPAATTNFGTVGF